jgi:ribosomal protein L37AE/L43A
MPVLQLNIWTCENCGDTVVVKEETMPFSDPVVLPPTEDDQEWDYVGEFPNEKLCCPSCVRNSRIG